MTSALFESLSVSDRPFISSTSKYKLRLTYPSVLLSPTLSSSEFAESTHQFSTRLVSVSHFFLKRFPPFFRSNGVHVNLGLYRSVCIKVAFFLMVRLRRTGS